MALGDKVLKFTTDMCSSGVIDFEDMEELDKELNQLIEYKEKYEKEKSYAKKFEDESNKLSISYETMCNRVSELEKENEQLKEQALLGRALEYFFKEYEPQSQRKTIAVEYNAMGNVVAFSLKGFKKWWELQQNTEEV